MKSKYAGVCGKEPTHTWKVDDEIFISKGTDDKWIMCVNKECYLSQGGKVFEGKKPFQVNKFPITEATTIYNLAEEILTSFKKKRQIEFDLKEEMVFIESFFRTLSGNFKP